MKRFLITIFLLSLVLTVFSQDYELAGFLELRGGAKIDNDVGERESSLSEGRLQIDFSKPFDVWSIKLKSDLVSDAIVRNQSIDIEKNSGWFQLREANISYFPNDIVEFKIGRQILTWGTGDLLFINDLFPKDWKSFFVGRDNEYLKAPSDALKVSFFIDWINFDLTYTPRFDPDSYIDVERLSYYSSTDDAIVMQKVEAVTFDDWFKEDEISLRIYGQKKGIEWAVYAYNGFWKSPKGFDISQNKPTFNELSEIGFSVRTNLLKGIFNIESGYYYSADDIHGDDPLVPNSQIKFLIGYEQEIVKNLTAGLQYYAEWTQNYNAIVDALGGEPKHPKEIRHLMTLRLTKLLMNQNLSVGGFIFWSPNEEDIHVRFMASYKINDHWKADAGANYFEGDKSSFFGQFKENNNIYMGVRYFF